VTSLKEKLSCLLDNPEWSNSDRRWLLEYLEKNDTSVLFQLMQEEFSVNTGVLTDMDDETAVRLLRRIRQQIGVGQKKVVHFNFKRWTAAAAIIVFLISGAYFLFIKRDAESPVSSGIIQTQRADILPGGNKAVLTLGDNSVIVLDESDNGKIANEGGVSVLKTDEGQLTYTELNEKPKEVVYNTVATPKGGQYHLTLSDGTKVWLNSASSVRFPVSFTGVERKVEITGEAYFEVAKNESVPFRVLVNGKEEVEVIGTHFNINSYPEEPSLKTTLLEGKIKVRPLESKGNVKILNPGQQFQLYNNGSIALNTNPDLEEVMAWKNGKFQFGESLEIAAVMRQISRWYDVDFEISGKINQHIGGSISRDVNVSKVFEMLELTGAVKFELNGRKVIVKAGKN